MEFSLEQLIVIADSAKAEAERNQFFSKERPEGFDAEREGKLLAVCFYAETCARKEISRIVREMKLKEKEKRT